MFFCRSVLRVSGGEEDQATRQAYASKLAHVDWAEWADGIAANKGEEGIDGWYLTVFATGVGKGRGE